MTLDEAFAIDQAQDLLPGGQGEHHFNVLDSAEKIDLQLNNFAENCRGFYYRNGITATLETCDVGVFIITFASDLSRIVKVCQDTGFIYWDSTLARVRGSYGYQECNSFEQPLETTVFDAKISMPTVNNYMTRAFESVRGD